MNSDFRIVENIILEYTGDEADVIIPYGVEEIGMMAFSYCDQLVSVQVPQTVRKIGHSAFAYCNNLEEVFIPDEVEEISGCAFTRCNNLIKFRLPAKYRTPYYILDLIGSDADVDAILAYNRKIECDNNQNKKYSIFELETMLEELIEKYSREEIPDTIEAIKEDNIDYPISEINSLVVRKHGMKLRKYMMTRNEGFFNVTNEKLLSDSDKDKLSDSKEGTTSIMPSSQIMTKEDLDNMIMILQERYEDEKASSIVQLAGENKDLNISSINKFSKLYYGMTRKELLIARGILSENDPIREMSGKVFDSETNQYVSEDEFFEAITEKLIDKYKNEKATKLLQVYDENKNIPTGSFNNWTKRAHGLTAKEYLLQKGVMVESVKGLSDDQVRELGEVYIDQLKTKYNDCKAQSLTQVIEENPEIKQGYLYKYAKLEGERGVKKMLEKEGIIASIRFGLELSEPDNEQASVVQEGVKSDQPTLNEAVILPSSDVLDLQAESEKVEIEQGIEATQNETANITEDAPIEVLALSTRPFKCLKKSGIDTIAQLKELSWEEICGIRNMGILSAEEIKSKLEQFGNGIWEPSVEPKKEEESDRLERLKREIPIGVLDLSVRARNCLKSRNYSLLNHLSGLSKKDLLEINNMGRGTAGEIIKKINVFLDENKALYDEELDIYDSPFIRGQTKKQIKEIIEGANYKDIELPDIVDAIGEEVPDAILNDLIAELIEEGSVVKNEDGYYCANYPSIFETIDSISNSRNRNIVRSYLEGQGLTQIARAYNISKQRVDQIVSNGIREAISNRGKVREDRFSHLFTTYDVKKGIWNSCIKEPEYIYLYLSSRYEKGDRPVIEALEDDFVSSDTRANIEDYLENPNMGIPKAADEYETSDDDPVVAEQMSLHFMEGKISYVTEYYDGLYESERDIELYKEKDEFERKAIKLKKRIARELKRKKYISDIKVSDEEYDLLRAYLHYAVPIIQKMSIIPDKDLFITAVVHAAIRAYKDGNFWANFHEEIRVKQKPQYRTAIGGAFYSVLEERDMIRVAPNEYVQNILLHCFISNNYADKYFDFIYAFYRIDLDRDIDRLDRNMMNELMNSICAEENEGRTFMLVKHIGQAMAANQRGAKIRIRSHLKLMDRFFWDDQYEIKTNHRIKGLLQEWVRKSDRMKTDIEEYKTGRKRGKKLFSHPYIYLNEETDTVSIVLPAQSIKEYDTDEISWHIYGKEEDVIPVEMTESVLGLKVLETDTSIAWENVLDEFRIELTADDTREVIKRFKIQADSVRLFDDGGYPVNSNSIKVGDVIAVCEKDAVIDSNALYDSRTAGNMLISYFQFEYEDIVKLPDGHAVIVGKKEIVNTIAGKGKVDGAKCEIDGKEYALYGKIPYLVLRMKSERARGTSISINGEKHRLTDLDYKEFSLDDRSNDTGYYMNLASVIGEDADDLYRIEVDIPNSASKAWNFVYIRNFEVKFEDAPYVFEPRGTACFPEHVRIKWIEEGCEKENGINAYKFEVKIVNRTLDFITFAGEKEVLVNMLIPAFFMKDEDGEWNSEKPSPVWYSDLPDVLSLSVPYHKVKLYMEEDDSEDGDTEIRELEYRKIIGDTHIECDITKFKSYLSCDDAIKQLGMKFGNVDEPLLDIMIHSSVITCQLIGDFKENSLIVDAVIQGKSQYYADVMQNGSVIAEKVPIIDGKARIAWEIENAWYDVEIFELEQDDSGFGEEEFYSLGKFNQQLLNPYDMSHRSFKVIRIEKRDDSAETMPLGYSYYVENLEKTEKRDVYEGLMVVEKNLGEVTAALPVHVVFEDIDNPTYVWITFLDEYNEEMDFLYDTRRKGILQEENSRISKLACYRRYTVLDGYEDIFHIEFCERDERDYDGADELIIFPEDTTLFRFKSSNSKHKKKEKPISDITWNKGAYACLLRTGYSTLEQLSEKTKIEFMKASGAPDDVTDYIERIMDFYGYHFAEKSKSMLTVPEGAVALPKTHGIRIADVKLRNAKARACLDRAGIVTLDQLAAMTKDDFAKLRLASDKVILRVEEVMKEYGYHFKEQ